jgi:hypothetical protein
VSFEEASGQTDCTLPEGSKVKEEDYLVLVWLLWEIPDDLLSAWCDELAGDTTERRTG